MRKSAVLLLAALMLSFCAASCGGAKTRFIAYDYSFDTDVTLIAYCSSEKEFDSLRQTVLGEMRRLHRIFDIYHTYEGVNNLCTVNALAGRAASAEPEVLELLAFGKTVYDLTGGRVNIAMGAVLSLWHEARETGVLPEESALRAAGEHCAMKNLRLDPETNTVTLLDPAMSLDVGAVAKGWAAQRAADAAVQAGYTDFVLSAGGNVIARGQAGGRPWRVGVRDPQSEDGAALAAQLEASDTALVTSGGYERNLTVDGKTYCHIIDPATLYPADKLLSATVVLDDSGLADAYSTALFLMEPQEALDFARAHHFRALIIDKSGAVLDSGE